MIEYSDSKSCCGRLADSLAGLNLQLRRSTSPTSTNDTIPPVVPRLVVASRLWAVLGKNFGEPDLEKLGIQLGELTRVWKESPAVFPPDRVSVMERLADLLETLFRI